MADWQFRFTPEESENLAHLKTELESIFGYGPDDEDDESVKFDAKSGMFDSDIAPLLKRLNFTGEVLSDGENSGHVIQEWTFENGEKTDSYDVED